MDAGTLLTLLLGGGGVAFAGAVFAGLKSLKEGARGREKEALARIAQWNEDSEARADREQARAIKAERQRDALNIYTARLERVLIVNGHDLPLKPLALEGDDDA